MWHLGWEQDTEQGHSPEEITVMDTKLPHNRCAVPKGAADKVWPQLQQEALERGQRNQNWLHGGGGIKITEG